MKIIIIIFFVLNRFISYSLDREKFLGIEYLYSNTESFGDFIPSLSISYTNDFSLILTREWPEFNYQNPSYLIELYKGNYYLLLGYGKYNEEIIGIDYIFKTFTTGIKINSYKELRVKFYKFQKDFYLKNGDILSSRINIVDDNVISTNYMIKYKSNFWAYSHYFDFNILNKGLLELQLNKLIKKMTLKLAYAREFESKKNGFSISVGTKF